MIRLLAPAGARRRTGIPMAALVAAGLVAAPAEAQVHLVDEGSFTITRGGNTGREDFSIVQTPGAGGPVFIAKATVSEGARRLAPALRTDTAGSPLAYQVEVRSGTETEERLRGVFDRRRFSATITTPRGESAKEYLVADGAVILDDDVFHQYYFVAQSGRTGTIPVVVPRRNAQVMMTLARRGQETITVGGRSVPATHLTLSGPGGDVREIWTDAEGRVLRVTIPGRDVVAVRDAMPR